MGQNLPITTVPPFEPAEVNFDNLCERSAKDDFRLQGKT